jgi:hypothetical protein
MWYTILIMLVVDIGGLLLVYVLLRDRVRRATTVESQIADVREEVSRLLVELNQTTDRNIALIEDRIARLNESLATADKKIGLLRREIEKHDVGSQIYSRLAEGRPPSMAADAGIPPGPGAGMGSSPAPIAALAVELSSMAEPRGGRRRDELRVETGGAGEKPDLHQRVITLYGAGFSPALIASRVGVPLGEVELIISLEQRKGRM